VFNSNRLKVTVIPYDKTLDTFLDEGAIGYILKPFLSILL
jgi:hypothetical protein